MNEKIGRNDPCPCGSGKKYKKCCITKMVDNNENELNELYRFEPGSYGDAGSYMPSLACLKQIRKDEEIDIKNPKNGIVIASEIVGSIESPKNL